jgi:HD superfamily phosphohydrolase
MEHVYWRRVLRMAALCHDIGHLPFSHAAEAELLPHGWDHERLTVELILAEELTKKWKALKIVPEDVAKIAVGPKKYQREQMSEWETILSEIITGSAFGVDRMDYLLRDSLHAGVAYGKFDHFRLIDTIRILPRVVDGGESTTPVGTETAASPSLPLTVPTLGIEEGGLHSAESLVLARYFMYTQLYFHPVRRIYDLHLKTFLKQWLDGGAFSTHLDAHLQLTDHEVMAAILAASRHDARPGYEPARRIVERDHFRTLYQRNPNDIAVNPDAARAIAEAASCKFDDSNVHYDSYREKNRPLDFPVLMRDDRIVPCLEVSDTLKNVPYVAVDFVFIAPQLREKAEAWLRAQRDTIIVPKPENSP